MHRARVPALALLVGLLTALLPVLPRVAEAVQPPIAFSAAASSSYQVDGVAWAVATSGDLAFVGGSFSAVRPPGAPDGTSEQVRTNLAVLDARTGAPTSCAPAVTFTGAPQNAAVRDLAVSPDGRTLYVAGSFTTVQGVPQQHLAAIDIATCSLVRSFSPLPNGPVRAVVATATTVYFGGTLSSVQGTGRTNVAAVSAVGTTAPAALLPWAPSLQGELWALAVRPGGSAVVLGGSFGSVNGTDSHALAVVHPTTGASLRSYPGFIHAASNVKDLAVDETGFYTANEGAGPGVFDGRIALDWSTLGERWRDTCLGATQAVEVHAGVVYSGSHAHDCTSKDEFSDGPRHHLLAQAVGDRALLTWFPDTDDGIDEKIGPRDLAVAQTSTVGAVLFVVGEFTTVNGSPQQGITRFPSGGTDTTPPDLPLVSVTSSRPGEARVAWQLSSDPDDASLTYRVLRDGASTPVHTVTRSSTFWTRRQATFTDTGLAPGSRHTYRISVSNGTTTLTTVAREVLVASTTSAYRDRVLADGASSLWRYDEPGDVFLADDTANDANGRLLGSATYGVTPTGLRQDASRAATLGGGSTIYSVARYRSPTAFTVETWFRTTTTTGGKLIGFGDKQTTLSTGYDRHVYMANDGRLLFGVNPGPVATISTSRAYNDGQWHHVAATQGAGGMDLYVDGALQAHGTPTTGQPFAGGYWRVGGDNLAGWPSAPTSSSWAGSLDETAVYPVALSAQAISAHVALATGPVVQPAGSTYRPLDPRRLLDTRTGTGAPTAKVAAKGTLRLQVTGPAGSGLAPVGSTAVVLNVTVTNPATDGFVAVYPTGFAGGPDTSSVNYRAGSTVPNLVLSKVAADGTVTLYNDQGSVDLIADLQGSYLPDTAGSSYRPLDPRRLLDTRDGTGGVPATRVGARGTVKLQVTGAAGTGLAPVGSTAVVLNVTATNPSTAGFVAVYPTGFAGGPSTSSVNFETGQTSANLVLSKVAADGTVTLYNEQGSVDVIADLAGSFVPDASGSLYRPLDPRRLLDTRNGTGAPIRKVGAQGTLVLQVTGPTGSGLAPVGSTAVVLNVTATNPSVDGFVAVYPSGYAGGPGTSSVNFVAGGTRSNLVVSKVAADGTVTLYNRQGTVDLIADVQGSFGAP